MELTRRDAAAALAAIGATGGVALGVRRASDDGGKRRGGGRRRLHVGRRGSPGRRGGR
ncbi:hypothetical protein [Halorubrum sp. CBA1125]|uniref:hypothetical protein n=1 Tax=Halorubrum sp. CBA1125 TaxID=2668072 RepID=UPI0037445F76